MASMTVYHDNTLSFVLECSQFAQAIIYQLSNGVFSIDANDHIFATTNDKSGPENASEATYRHRIENSKIKGIDLVYFLQTDGIVRRSPLFLYLICFQLMMPNNAKLQIFGLGYSIRLGKDSYVTDNWQHIMTDECSS